MNTPRQSKRWLGLTVDGDINDIGSSSGTGEHARSGDTSRVVRVDVDRQVGELLAKGTDEAAKRGSQQPVFRDLARKNGARTS